MPSFVLQMRLGNLQKYPEQMSIRTELGFNTALEQA